MTAPVTIKLQASGVRIVPATVEQPRTAHHHLFVDPLKPGSHRVIAVLADWRHIPLNRLVADTVTFTVK
ncbi:MAG TPA: hypothetical protein VEU73_02735 [Gemmatimonadales bacterium]|nr:hypothetical protein [Gemmatimonadales bacterium]